MACCAWPTFPQGKADSQRTKVERACKTRPATLATTSRSNHKHHTKHSKAHPLSGEGGWLAEG